MRILVILALIMLAACAPIPLQEGNATRPILENHTERPTFEHTNVPDEPITTPDETYVPGDFLHDELPPPNAPSHLLFPFGKRLGDAYPRLSDQQVGALRGKPILPEGITYTQEIRLGFSKNTSGNLTFFRNDDDELDTGLFFAQDAPILEYRLRLDQGHLWDLEGKEITILGDVYVVTEVTNKTIELFGKSFGNDLFFQDGAPLLVNNSRWSGTKVFVDRQGFGYTLSAPEDIFLEPGQSLSERLGWQRLASRNYDIRYLGLETDTLLPVHFESNKLGYRLETIVGDRTFTLPLVDRDAGKLVLGSLDSPLRMCTGYCISEDDSFVLTTAQGPRLVEYRGGDNKSSTLRLRIDGNDYALDFDGIAGHGAHASIIIDDQPFSIGIGKVDNTSGEFNISVSGVAKRIELAQDLTLEFIAIHDDTLELELRSRLGKVPLNLTYDSGWIVRVGGMTFHEIDDVDDTIGFTSWGAAVLLLKKDPMELDTGEEATIAIPHARAQGRVEII